MGGGGEGTAMDQNTELRVGSFEGTGGLDLGAGMDTRTIPTPSWKKIGGVESDASSASTYVRDGKSLYSKLINLRKGQRASETILKGERRIVMLLKWGEENMKIDV